MDSPDDIASLALETDAMFDGDPILHGTTQLARALPRAIAAIVHLAEHGESDRVRLTAAQFIVDRVLPKPEKDPGGKRGLDSPFEKLLGNVVHELDAAAVHESLDVTVQLPNEGPPE